MRIKFIQNLIGFALGKQQKEKLIRVQENMNNIYHIEEVN